MQDELRTHVHQKHFEKSKILRCTIVNANMSFVARVPRFLFLEALFDNNIEAINFFKYLNKLRPLLVESSLMVMRVLNFWMRDAVVIWPFSTKFTLEVNLLILAFHWNAWTNIRLCWCNTLEILVVLVKLHYTTYLLIVHYLRKTNLFQARR